MDLLSKSIEYLPGVGQERAKLLKSELNIHTFRDLLFYFPFRYVDKSKLSDEKKINTQIGEMILYKGIISNYNFLGAHKASSRLEATFVTENDSMIKLCWFQGGQWIEKKLKIGQMFVCYGKLNIFNKELQIAHPELETWEDWKNNPYKWEAIYSITEYLKQRKLFSSTIHKLQRVLFQNLSEKDLPEILPNYILKAFSLMERWSSMKEIHHPTSSENLTKARERLKFEEVFWFQLRLAYQQSKLSLQKKGPVFESVGEYFNQYYKSLPYELTHAQKKVIKEIRQDCYTGQAMHRLLQGDVGSGKTIVALMSMLMALDNGFQTCLVVPTEVLALQHYASFVEGCQFLNIYISLLTGNTSTADRKKIHQQLLDGSLQILIGTHALLEDTVQFKNLGLVVIDEQHRFGVEQRAKLLKKSQLQPHVLIMTATPIPRTLALTLHSDLDYSVIDEMPKGRKPIHTIHRWDHQRILAYKFIKEEIDKGRQAYIIFPLIEESEKLNYEDLMTGYEQVKDFFDKDGLTISLVHGQMNKELKDANMQRFVKGETKIMVATTVVEVGVNVPNATVILIESSEKFGLSQLHQLRGRVGRGHYQSYCILLSGSKISEDSQKRIRIMTSTNDGFKIAEKDLELRGPGDILGTKQSGTLPFKLLDIILDQSLILKSRNMVTKIIQQDSSLAHSENLLLKQFIENELTTKDSWLMIG